MARVLLSCEVFETLTCMRYYAAKLQNLGTKLQLFIATELALHNLVERIGETGDNGDLRVDGVKLHKLSNGLILTILHIVDNFASLSLINNSFLLTIQTRVLYLMTNSFVHGFVHFVSSKLCSGLNRHLVNSFQCS